MSLCDARGAELFVDDLVGTVTSGQNAMIIVGTVRALHEVKITVEVVSASFVGEPIGSWTRKLPEVGVEIKLNAYRVFRLGPCPCARRDEELERLRNE